MTDAATQLDTPAREASARWQVGAVTVTAVVESQTEGIPPAFMFPAGNEELVLRHPWLVPAWADTAGNVALRVQAFVLQVAGRTILLDPCVGNGRQREQPWFADLQTPFLQRLAAVGVEPGTVTEVLHTHLHVDHVGWGTRREGDAWVPTFPGARYGYVEPELAWLQSRDDEDARRIHADSVQPVLDAGLADLLPVDADLGDGSGWCRRRATPRGTSPCGSNPTTRSPWSRATPSTTRSSSPSPTWPSCPTMTWPGPAPAARASSARPPPGQPSCSAPTSPPPPPATSWPMAPSGGSKPLPASPWADRRSRGLDLAVRSAGPGDHRGGGGGA